MTSPTPEHLLSQARDFQSRAVELKARARMANQLAWRLRRQALQLLEASTEARQGDLKDSEKEKSHG